MTSMLVPVGAVLRSGTVPEPATAPTAAAALSTDAANDVMQVESSPPSGIDAATTSPTAPSPDEPRCVEPSARSAVEPSTVVSRPERSPLGRRGGAFKPKSRGVPKSFSQTFPAPPSQSTANVSHASAKRSSSSSRSFSKQQREQQPQPVPLSSQRGSGTCGVSGWDSISPPQTSREVASRANSASASLRGPGALPRTRTASGKSLKKRSSSERAARSEAADNAPVGLDPNVRCATLLQECMWHDARTEAWVASPGTERWACLEITHGWLSFAEGALQSLFSPP